MESQPHTFYSIVKIFSIKTLKHNNTERISFTFTSVECFLKRHTYLLTFTSDTLISKGRMTGLKGISIFGSTTQTYTYYIHL